MTVRIDRDRLWGDLTRLKEIAATCPTAMIFMAGEHGGISHTPRADVPANAVRTLAEVVS